MLHKEPESKKLNEQIASLMKDYNESKGKQKNEHRVKLISFIESFQQEKDFKYSDAVALGACTHGLIAVDGGLGLFYSSPENKSFMGSYLQTGSKLGKLLQNALNITPSNPLDNQRAMIYLSALYERLDKFPRKIDGALEDNRECKNEVKRSISLVLSDLTLKRPTASAISNSLTRLANDYSGSSLERKQYVQLGSGITDALIDAKSANAALIQTAVLVFVMEKIEKEYKYVSPKGGYFHKGSELYKCCESALNIQYSCKEIPDNLKKKYYIALLGYLLFDLTPEDVVKWEKRGLKGAKKFFEELQDELEQKVAAIIQVSNPGAISLSYVDVVSSTAASYGVNIALGKIALEMSLRGSTLTYFNLLKPEAALLITLLAFALRSVVAQKATSAVNSIIVNTVTQPVMITFSSVKRLGDFCTYMVSSNPVLRSMDLLDDPEFMQALAKLPDDVFTDALKEKMTYVVNYQKPAKVESEDTIALRKS